ncbi:MAG: hypothetical protein V1810_04265 [Candidatus Beckwithbacteria bacterium]
MASLIETMVNQLASELVPQAQWGQEKKKQQNILEAKKKYFWHELKTLSQNIPKSEWEQGQLLWLTLNHFVSLPDIFHDQEVNHDYGTVKALATGISKSVLHQQPMLELHGTACPSYVPFEQWQAQGLSGAEIASGQLIQKKIDNLQTLTAGLASYSGKYFTDLLIHTPSPADRNCDFCDHMEESMLEIKNGNDQLAKHWQMMQNLATQVKGLQVVSDLPYLTQYFSDKQAQEWLTEDQQLQAAYDKFITSRYIYDCYLQWGKVNKFSIFCGLYLGTVVAYGNHVNAFDLTNSDPVKLYLNFEEHHGPETFAGLMTGVDVRHILKNYGYHLPLLVADQRLRTPWVED